jgi:hypothetical protein
LFVQSCRRRGEWGGDSLTSSFRGTLNARPLRQYVIAFRQSKHELTNSPEKRFESFSMNAAVLFQVNGNIMKKIGRLNILFYCRSVLCIL